VLEATGAVRAASAVRERHDRDPIAGGDTRNTRADRDDFSSEFVSENLWVLGAREWVRLDRRDDRPGDVFVQIGATDPAGRDPYDDFVVARIAGLGHVFDSKIACVVEAQRLHYVMERSARPASGRTDP
jgi:hypothetical protein